jgi:hypothetical protein
MVDRGVVEELTTIRYQTDAAPGDAHLASVRTAGGVLLLARLEGEVESGTAVTLTLSAAGAILGRRTSLSGAGASRRVGRR